MLDFEAAGLAAIEAVWGTSVIYVNAAGLAPNTQVTAIKSDEPADQFQGPGATTRHVSFEIRQAALPRDPVRNDMILEGAIVWRVIGAVRRDDVAAWAINVERAS